MKKCTLVILCLILLGSCIPNSDYTEELSGDYFYRDEGTHVKDILSHLANGKEIYSEVLEYTYNSDFIIAAQTPVYEEYVSMIAFNLRDDSTKYHGDSDETRMKSEREADSILKHDSYYLSIFKHKINYWIIAHKTKTTYGPLQKEEYLKKRKELHIPDWVSIKME